MLNWCEVFYDFHRASGPIDALGAVKDLARVGVAENAEIGTEFWQAVGTLKATGGFRLPIVSRWPSPTSLALRF